MATVFNSLFHGAIAGGTTCYLQERLTEEKNSESAESWTTGALQFNHLLLLTAETIRSANVALGVLGLLVRSVYVLTPLIFFVGYRTEKISKFEGEFLESFNSFYYTGVVVNIVATLALGNLAFALASLAMLALNAGVSGDLLAPVKKILASCALIGYGAQVFGAEGFMAALAKTSTIAMGLKLWVFDFFEKKKVAPVKVEEPVVVQNPPSLFSRAYRKVENVAKGIFSWPFRRRAPERVIYVPEPTYVHIPTYSPPVIQENHYYYPTYHEKWSAPSHSTIEVPSAPVVEIPSNDNGLAKAFVRPGAWS